jgi:outer membrane protein TolC
MVATLSFAADTGSNRRLVGGAGAGTIDGALIEAYRNNPQLNAQRAATRAIDENVPTALSGYRPRVTGTSSLTEQYLDTLTRRGARRATARSTTSKPAASRCRRLD